MAKTVQEIMQLIREQNIQMVDFKMVDINGQYRHVTIPARNFSEETMKSGIGFDASNYGYAVVEKSDMVFIPDPDTAVIDPFCQVSTLSMTGNAMIIDNPENRPLAQYPRNIVLAANELATPGNKAIYVRITSPDGYVLTTESMPTFEFEGSAISYSAMREVDYQNADLEVGIYFNSSGFATGTYKIELYMEGRMIGSTEIAMR